MKSSSGLCLLRLPPACQSSRAVEDFRFATDLRVRFSETDAQGVVHNAVYLVWFEIARIAYLARFRGGYRGFGKRTASMRPRSRAMFAT